MSFTPKVSFVSCIKFGSFTQNKETLFYKHFSSPQSGHFHPQTLQQQVARFCRGQRRRPWGPSSSLLGPNTTMPWWHPGRTDSAEEAWRQGLCRGGWKEGEPPASGACGRAPHAGRDGTGTPLPCRRGVLSPPGHPTQTPAGCSPAPQPLPLSRNLSCCH